MADWLYPGVVDAHRVDPENSPRSPMAPPGDLDAHKGVKCPTTTLHQLANSPTARELNDPSVLLLI
jgi:hypothetical protein